MDNTESNYTTMVNLLQCHQRPIMRNPLFLFIVSGMTRFARARGSKSSNKREPEEATSWCKLKECLLKKSDPTTADANALEIQKCKDTLKALQQQDSMTTTWATFDEDYRGETSKVETKVPKKEKYIKLDKNINNKLNDSKKRKMHSIEDSNGPVKGKKAIKKKQKNIDAEEAGILSSVVMNLGEKEDHKNDDMRKLNSPDLNNSNIKNIEKKKKDNKEKGLIPPTQLLNENVKKEQKHGETKKNKKKSTKIGKYKIHQDIDQTELTNELGEADNPREAMEGEMKKVKIHHKNEKEYRRRKPMPVPYQMDLNGEMVDVVTYDGFPIMLQDAKRLEELKKSLYAKGISNGEIKKIMKLQRRSAEKTLTRARKKVCFNCRRSGHPLSECPSLNQGEGTGICFKCGSTEHTHFECKVVRKQEFKFAQCFICKEQGHISNQCPDNPRGLYPKGGACKLCGDVTHLKRFCPTLPNQSEPTIDNFLDEEDTRQKRFPNKTNAKTDKIVRF